MGPTRVQFRPSLVVALVTSCVACAEQTPASSPQSGVSFREGLQRLCEVDEHGGLSPSEDPVTIESERYNWALANVEHPDVIELVTLMRVKSVPERVTMLHDACAQAQLKNCPLADTLAQEDAPF